MQFLAGGKPLATTCACTPLDLADGSTALLIAAIDPIEADVLGSGAELAADSATEGLLPAGSDYLLIADANIVGGSARGRARATETGLPEREDVVRLQADAKGTVMLVFPAETGGAATAPQLTPAPVEPAESTQDMADLPEPMLPLGLAPLPEESHSPVASDDWVDPLPSPPQRGLTALFDRLAEDAELYTSLSAADEAFPGATDRTEAAEAAPEEPVSGSAPIEVPDPGPDLIAAVIEYSDDPEAVDGLAPQSESPSLWMITGRGFRALKPEPSAESEGSELSLPETAIAAPEDASTPVTTLDAAPDPETAERVSRYNFEELGRILTDRVAGESASPASHEPAPRSAPPAGVVSLSAETLVLNRLPLAILVFRDQQVLFANRALTDLLGHESVESLRAAGIASIFPSENGASAGPVNRLVRRGGAVLPVTARLQSVSWQGRAALMLSAGPTEPERGHEGAVRAFAEIAAETQDEGFFIANRGGTLTRLSARAAMLLGREETDLVGKPLAVLVAQADMEPLRAFLEKPARFAETARPSLAMASEDGGAELAIFAEGQAGVINGYFGFVRKRVPTPTPVSGITEDEAEPSILGRLSRGIRRPLNTIIGFADLIRSTGLGASDAERYVEYARDIRTAGLEIAVLVDELDDFTRLREGRYPARHADVDLAALLQASVLRVKGQAGAARVLVRSAIAETLPHIRADRASLGQALLNLLASAIDQTPIGGSVIVSAQKQDDGGVAIHVRDGANGAGDLAERFVVFRDGLDKDGQQLEPVRSSVGLALTRSLLAVNACSLAVDPTSGTGTLFSLLIPSELVATE